MAMEERVTQDMVDAFFELTKFDVGAYIDNYVSFIQNDYPSILRYYDTANTKWPAKEVETCKKLLKDAHNVEELLTIHGESLDAYKFWVLSEHLDDMRWALETASRAEMWSRSVPVFKNTAVTSVIMSQGQVLEGVSNDVVLSSDPDNWVNIGLENRLMETDYNTEGGKLLRFRFNVNGVTKIYSVLDGLDVPEKIYGKDIDANLNFVYTEETIDNPFGAPIKATSVDLAVLNYEETLMQTIKILMSLKYGDDPSFPERGMKLKLGSSTAGLSYPAISRELSANFATDDSFNAISITDVSLDQDAVFVNFEVETKIGTVRESLMPM